MGCPCLLAGWLASSLAEQLRLDISALVRTAPPVSQLWPTWIRKVMPLFSVHYPYTLGTMSWVQATELNAQTNSSTTDIFIIVAV
jgi:hypothetical protein